MKTNYLTKLHKRSLDILEMIDKAKDYETEAGYNLKRWDSTSANNIFRLVNKRDKIEQELAKYGSIRQRLTLSYLKTLDKINAELFEYLKAKNGNKISQPENY